MKVKSVFSILLVSLILAQTKPILGQSQAVTSDAVGTIKGQVIDAITKSPVVGASILVTGAKIGAATDTSGEFTIRNLPVGSYSLSISSISYDPTSRTDIIVKPKRISHIVVELVSHAIEIEGAVVTGSYFTDRPNQPTSTTDFTGEEVRRSPGSAGDVSRIVMVLPSIAKVNDQINSLVVRGGTPTENGFYLDNIEIPNINHYPLQGSSGGPIGLLNVDFIQDVSFSAGGFSAGYGDRLSSIMDLQFREGNRDEFDAQVDMNFAGLSLAAEGPFGGKKGSWLFSARRSFLDLLVKAIGTGVAPVYSDYQGKLVYDLSSKHKLTFLGVYGIDYIEFDKEQSEDDGNVAYGKWDGYEYSVGFNWRYLWSKNGYSNTSLSLLSTNYKGIFYETKSDDRLADENSLERRAQLRNVNVYQFSESSFMEFGIESKYLFDDYDIFLTEYTNSLGDTVPPLILTDDVESPWAGTFASFTTSPFQRLSVTVGLRFDYFEYNDHSHISPRFSLSYLINETTTLNGATGIYYQNLPLSLLAQSERNRKLNDPVAYHYILGLSHQLSDDTKLTVEGYYKRYNSFPMDPQQPQLFIPDELVYRGFFGNFEELVDNGIAESYGIEVTVQKKLVRGVYGLISGAFFKARYHGLDGFWRDRVIDNEILFSVEGGYKPNNKWEYSLRWIYAGGPPYTALDVETSKLINRTVLNGSAVNQIRYPDYHSLNVRVDRRFNFSGSNLIVYFSVWNFYNRKNVWSYYWNEVEEKPDVLYQWSLLPVFGLEFEF